MILEGELDPVILLLLSAMRKDVTFKWRKPYD